MLINFIELELNERQIKNIDDYLEEAEYTARKLMYENKLSEVVDFFSTDFYEFQEKSFYFKAQTAYENFTFKINQEIAKVDKSFLKGEDKEEIIDGIREDHLEEISDYWENLKQQGIVHCLTTALSKLEDEVKDLKDIGTQDERAFVKEVNRRFKSVMNDYKNSNKLRNYRTNNLCGFEYKLNLIYEMG